MTYQRQTNKTYGYKRNIPETDQQHIPCYKRDILETAQQNMPGYKRDIPDR